MFRSRLFVFGLQLRAFVTAIDAMDYRYGQDLSVQFQPQPVQRELLKAFAGFALPPEVLGSAPPSTLATGNYLRASQPTIS